METSGKMEKYESGRAFGRMGNMVLCKHKKSTSKS